MNEDKLVRLILESFERQFPRECHCCGKMFQNYRDFILNTKLLDRPVSYDLDFFKGKFKPSFLGVLKYHNCECGDTITLRSFEPNPVKMLRIMLWVRQEHKRTGKSIEAMLRYYNQKVDALVLKRTAL